MSLMFAEIIISWVFFLVWNTRLKLDVTCGENIFEETLSESFEFWFNLKNLIALFFCVLYKLDTLMNTVVFWRCYLMFVCQIIQATLNWSSPKGSSIWLCLIHALCLAILLNRRCDHIIRHWNYIPGIRYIKKSSTWHIWFLTNKKRHIKCYMLKQMYLIPASFSADKYAGLRERNAILAKKQGGLRSLQLFFVVNAETSDRLLVVIACCSDVVKGWMFCRK